jgi:hypothetical protein
MPRSPKIEICNKITKRYIQLSRTFKFKKAIDKYTQIAIEKNSQRFTNKEYELIAKQIYPIPNRFDVLRVRRMIEDVKEIKEMCETALQTALIQNNVSINSALKEIDESYNVAKDKKDAATMLKIAQFRLELLNVHSKQAQQSTVIREQINYKALNDSINEPKQADNSANIDKSVTITRTTSTQA